MTTRLAFSSPRQTCYGVLEFAKSRFDHLVARSWNMYEPDTTQWWLVPAVDWPAFPHGKLYFNWAGEDRQHLWVGFHSEKGLDPKIKAAYPSAKGERLIMRPDWHWFTLLKSLEDGRLAGVTRQVTAALDAPILIRLAGSYVGDPTEFDPYSTLLKQDEYELAWDKAQDRFTVQAVRTDGDVLDGLVQVDSFERLAQELRRLTQNNWLWLNFYYLAVVAGRDHPADQSVSAWDGRELWSDYLRHFRRLLI